MKHKITTFIRKHSTILIVLFLLILALVLRISILGFHDIPEQARTLDASYHIAMAEWMQHGNLKLMPSYLALGYEDAVQFHPPLVYLIPALMGNVVNIQAWNAAWLYFSLISALGVIVLYFIGKKLISEDAGLIAASLYVFPFPIIWIFPLYSGMFGLVIGQFLLVLEILLLYSYYKKRSRKTIWALSAAIVLQLLSHFPETFIFIPFLLLAFFEKLIITKNKKIIADFALLLFLPLISFIWYAPKLFNVWLMQIESGYHLMPEITSRLGSIIEMAKMADFWALQIPIIIFLLWGIYFLITKREWFWLQAAVYFIGTALFMPYFADEAEFYVKFRFFLPLIAYPIAAYGLVNALETVKLNKKFIIYCIIAAILALSLLSFGEFQNKGLYKPLTKEKYEALKWIENNTETESKIIFLNGYEAFTSSFAHRTCFEVYPDSFKESIISNKTNGYDGLWCGFFWSEHYKENYLLPYEKSFFEYEYHERITNTSVYEFEYAVYTDELKEYNERLKLENFGEIHHEHGIHVMKNCRKLKC